MAPTDKPFLAELAGKSADRVPIWLMRQAGRYLPEYRALRATAGSFLDLCYSPEMAAEVTLQPVRRFPLDAAIVFSDILVIPDALGQEVTFKEGEGPVLDPVRDEKALSALNTDRLVAHLAPVYETLQRVRADLADNVALIGFAGAPWTIATYMVEGHGSRDYAETKGWAAAAPESFAHLIGLLENAITEHLIAQIKAGAEAVQIFDSWAGMLSDPMFERWSLEPIARIAARVKQAAPEVPIIAFPRLAGLRYRKFTAIDAIDALGLDQTVSLDWARDELQGRKTLQGNLDSAVLLAGGAAMEQEAHRILGELSAGRFVFNLGHGVLQPTPPEHVAALCDIVHGWNRRG
jgi:uroporphyrinogen decarboxylase